MSAIGAVRCRSTRRAAIAAGAARAASPFYVGCRVGALLWSAPLFILVFTALKTPADFAHERHLRLPRTFEWANFAKAWRLGIKTYFVNSLILTLIKVPTGVFICSLAAFALAKMRMRGASALFTIFLIGLIVPMQMTLVPLTILYQRSVSSTAWPACSCSISASACRSESWCCAASSATFPNELIEAALIDGCSWCGVYWRIVMPLAKPAVVSLLILDGISTWNEFILAQIFLRTESQRTLPLGVVMFRPNSRPRTNCSRPPSSSPSCR